jgi:hypothetical protein
MKKIISATLTAVALVLTAYTQSATLESFASLAGCWERNDRGSIFAEMWMKPAGTSIMGTGRTVKNGKTADYEYLRIEQREDAIYYVAKPRANAQETAFKLVKWAANDFVFENPEHDFPQRILYKINGDSLTARIEGTRNGKTSAFDFPMKRTACN